MSAAQSPAAHSPAAQSPAAQYQATESPAADATWADLSRRRAGLWLCLLLAAAAVLFAVGIGWGMPDWRGWSGDEMHPESWERAITPETHRGWHARYPPLHFQVLHHLSQPLRRAMQPGGPLERDAWHQNVTLIHFSRWVSLAMALLTLWVVYGLGRRLAGARGGRRTGLFAAAVMALTAPYVYYAKTANLEAPYLLWIALSLLFLLRLVEPGGARDAAGEPFAPPRLLDAVGFGLAAAAAVATKDQAYALFALMPVPVWLALSRRQRGAGRGERLLRALVDRRFLAAGASAILGYALFQGIFTNRVRFEHHVELLLGPMSGPYREFGHGLGDQLRLAYRFLHQLVFSLDPLLFLAGAGGVAWIFVRWRRARRGAEAAGAEAAGAEAAATATKAAPPTRAASPSPDVREAWLLATLLTVAVSYYLALIAVIGFTFDRYVLPVTMVLSLAAGRFFSLLLERARAATAGRRRLVRSAVAAVFVFAVFYASSVDTRMLVDSRYRVEEYLAERAGVEPRGKPQVAVAIGRPKHVPRLHRLGWPQVLRSRGRVLEQAAPRFVTVSITDVRSPGERAFVAELDSGRLGYLRVLTHRGDPAWNLLYIGNRFGDPATAQRFVNPEFAVWERIGGAPPERPAQPSPGSAAGPAPPDGGPGDDGGAGEADDGVAGEAPPSPANGGNR